MWLLLNGAVTIGNVMIGGLVALAAVRARARLQPASDPATPPVAAVTLAGTVVADIVRSNIAVAAIVLRAAPATARRLRRDCSEDTRNPAALAALACIITATPGTAWAGYDAQSNTLRCMSWTSSTARSRAHDQAALRARADGDLRMSQSLLAPRSRGTGPARARDGMRCARLMIGPRAQDRVLALDTLYVDAMLLILVFGMREGATSTSRSRW